MPTIHVACNFAHKRSERATSVGAVTITDADASHRSIPSSLHVQINRLPPTTVLQLLHFNTLRILTLNNFQLISDVLI